MADLHAVVVDEIRRREGLIVDDRHTRELVAALRAAVGWHQRYERGEVADWRCCSCRTATNEPEPAPCAPLVDIAAALGVVVRDGD